MKPLRDLFVERRSRLLEPISERLQAHLTELSRSWPRIDRVSVRAKGVDRFIAKAEKEENGRRKYNDPLNQIQDQIGARIVTFYKRDAERLAAEVKKYFRHIEQLQIVPDSEREFGYEGIHFIIFLPDDVLDDTFDRANCIDFFELQIKTLFQHAWSEADHDLGYKPSNPLTRDQKRLLAFTAAQAWGADRIFDELFGETFGAPHSVS